MHCNWIVIVVVFWLFSESEARGAEHHCALVSKETHETYMESSIKHVAELEKFSAEVELIAYEPMQCNGEVTVVVVRKDQLVVWTVYIDPKTGKALRTKNDEG